MVFNPGSGVGLRNVGSYQISGHPYITGSILGAGLEAQIDFPFVTRDFTVIASGSGNGPVLRLHFASTSSTNVIGGHHYVTLQADDQSYTFHHKCTGVFISCVSVSNADDGFEVVANLTGIDPHHMYDLTGSGLTE